MNYATVAELKLRFPETAGFGDNDDDIEEFLLTPAESEIDSRFSGYYEVPFMQTPPLVKDLTLTLALIRALEGVDMERAQKLRTFVDERIFSLTQGSEVLTGVNGQPLSKMREIKVWSNSPGYGRF